MWSYCQILPHTEGIRGIDQKQISLQYTRTGNIFQIICESASLDKEDYRSVCLETRMPTNETRELAHS